VAKNFSAIPDSKRTAVPGAKALGRANSHAVIEVTVKIRRKAAPPALEGRPAETMTRDQLAEQFGASQTDIDAVEKAFEAFGLTVVVANALTRTVLFSGTIAQIEAAFQVNLYNYSSDRGNYRGRVGSISVPSDVQDIVEGVFGLDTRRIAKRRRQPVLDDTGAKPIPTSWYIPSQLATHYNFPAGDGTGQTVGILEFGGGYFPKDLQMFCGLANVSVPTVTAISTDGTPTNSDDDAAGEVMLDIEIVAGVCPKAHIVVYFASWSEQGWITAIDAVINDSTNNPAVVSISWGNAEDTDIWTTSAIGQINQSLQDAAMLGITVCVAAGDDGSSDAVLDGHAHADFPASSPYVLAVGGTTIPTKGGTGADIVWKEGDGLRNDNGGSTGGGVSDVNARPTWQSAITVQSVNPGSINGRVIPDVAANADWDASPYLLVLDGQSGPNGGTSAATPLWASLITLINAAKGSRVGYLTPVLYQASGSSTIGAAGCTDVVSGDNNTAKADGYNAGPGYDACSGWGTPNGKNLAAALQSLT
jgi:kumamolisin